MFFLRIRRPPRSTLDRSSAASDVYKRQGHRRRCSQRGFPGRRLLPAQRVPLVDPRLVSAPRGHCSTGATVPGRTRWSFRTNPVSYTHLRAHETVLDLVCRLLLEKKHTNKKKKHKLSIIIETLIHTTKKHASVSKAASATSLTTSKTARQRR